MPYSKNKEIFIKIASEQFSESGKLAIFVGSEAREISSLLVLSKFRWVSSDRRVVDREEQR